MDVLNLFYQTLAKAMQFGFRIKTRILVSALRKRFAKCPADFYFDPSGDYSFSQIEIGNNVKLGIRPMLIAPNSRIIIGNHVMFGPEVTIRGGNHRIDVVGKYMYEVTEGMKRKEDDKGVVIEDDVWVGTRAIILHGVVIGKGSVIGAGAVVTKSVPPYSIAVGNPARVIRPRFSGESIHAHEDQLSQRR